MANAQISEAVRKFICDKAVHILIHMSHHIVHINHIHFPHILLQRHFLNSTVWGVTTS